MQFTRLYIHQMNHNDIFAPFVPGVPEYFYRHLCGDGTYIKVGLSWRLHGCSNAGFDIVLRFTDRQNVWIDLLSVWLSVSLSMSVCLFMSVCVWIKHVRTVEGELFGTITAAARNSKSWTFLGQSAFVFTRFRCELWRIILRKVAKSWRRTAFGDRGVDPDGRARGAIAPPNKNTGEVYFRSRPKNQTNDAKNTKMYRSACEISNISSLPGPPTQGHTGDSASFPLSLGPFHRPPPP